MNKIENPLEAYKVKSGPILLLAGPGTGKTYQLGERVKYLIDEREANYDEIAIITFTNEAARSMRRRLLKVVLKENPDKLPGIISTIHSLGNKIIGSSPEKIGLPKEFLVLNNSEIQKVLMEDACSISGYDREDYKILLECRIKGKCVRNDDIKKCRICNKYSELLRKTSRVDYDDLIYLANDLLNKDEGVRSKWKKKTKYLLVDEFQDINKAQLDFIKLLSKEQEEGLFIVGDDDQSIYSFRGGTPDYITDFKKYFGPNGYIGILSKSWRCPENILRGAKSMLNKYYKSPVTKPEPTFNSEEIKEKIFFYNVPSEKKETIKIGYLVENKIKDNKVIIIIPNKQYLPVIKSILKKHKIDYNYKIAFREDGLMRFNVISSWVKNQADNSTFRYLIYLITNNCDDLINENYTNKEGIKAKRKKANMQLAQIWSWVNSTKSLWEILIEKGEWHEEPNIYSGLVKRLKEVYEIINTHGGKRKYLSEMLEKCGLYVNPAKNPTGFFTELDDWKADILSNNITSEFDPVEIYNLHSSKGLQGDIVIFIGLSEELFPSKDRDLEEQARLFYVAMTRAKKELHLFHSRIRSAKITFKKKSFKLKPSQL